MNILSVKDVSYQVNSLEILKGITFDIEQGDCLSVVGQSGSGKSTLLKLCADLLPLSGGELKFKEKSYTAYQPTDLRKQISYCVQIPHLFGRTVYDNLNFPFQVRHEKMNREKVSELLKTFNLDESYIEKEINGLSGGEKQRIALIRNLIYTPDVLLLDEVTASLDKENAAVVERYIKKLNEKGVTVLWITHSETQSTSIFNKRLVIEDGKVSKLEVIGE
ncbi:MAG: ABC transporter ATP-binding protein [Cellulosilyticaceae bacterium]